LLGAGHTEAIALLFTNPNGSLCTMPCLFGVRPDDMTMDQALQILMTHPLTNNMRLQKIIGEGGTEIGFGLWSSSAVVWVKNSLPYTGDSRQIHDIVLLTTYGGLPAPTTKPQLANVLQTAELGNLILHFGNPDRVNFSGGGIDTPSDTTNIHIFYLSKHIGFVNTMSNGTYAMSPLISPDNAFSALDVFRSTESLETCKYWFGFISAAEYLNRASRAATGC